MSVRNVLKSVNAEIYVSFAGESAEWKLPARQQLQIDVMRWFQG
jgi:hypothetical protein